MKENCDFWGESRRVSYCAASPAVSIIMLTYGVPWGTPFRVFSVFAPMYAAEQPVRYAAGATGSRAVIAGLGMLLGSMRHRTDLLDELSRIFAALLLFLFPLGATLDYCLVLGRDHIAFRSVAIALLKWNSPHCSVHTQFVFHGQGSSVFRTCSSAALPWDRTPRA